MSKCIAVDLPDLPPELWLCIFQYATHVPGTLVPDIYDNAGLIGPIYTRHHHPSLREALVTKRALVRVCKLWWYLAMPCLYQSVYIGRARCLSSLSSTLVRSAEGKGSVVGSVRPLGEYTQRLDIAMRDHAQDVAAELVFLERLITCMPHLDIVSFATTTHYTRGSPLPDGIFRALHLSAASLQVLDLPTILPQPSTFQIIDLLAKCTQLRVLNYPKLIFPYGPLPYIPRTITTLRVGILDLSQTSSIHEDLSHHDPSTTRQRSAIRELVFDYFDSNISFSSAFFHVYGSQLVSVQFHMRGTCPMDIDNCLWLLGQECPNLRRLIITSALVFPFVSPLFILISPITISYLGFSVVRPQISKKDVRSFFAFLEDLRPIAPSLRVVRFLNEKNVQCLLENHTNMAIQMLRPFAEPEVPFRVEDEEGVLLTDRLKALGHL